MKKKIVALMLAVMMSMSACGAASVEESGSGSELTGSEEAGGGEIRREETGGEETGSEPTVTYVEKEFELPDRMVSDTRQVYVVEDKRAWYDDFSLELLRDYEAAGENVLVSPLSIMIAMAMTENGAEGNTLYQMEETFGIGREEMNEFLSDYLQNLPDSEDCKLKSAQSIWINDRIANLIYEEFKEENEKLYQAEINTVPFDEASVKKINKWLEEHTDKMIPSILDRFEEDDTMCLINALVFDAKWRNPYEEYQVGDADFTLTDGSVVPVEMMSSVEDHYLEGEQATGFLKYYKGGRYAFAALLPKEGITCSELLQNLTGAELKEILENASTEYKVRAKMPKFTADYSVSLKNWFPAKGMVDAFDSDLADFSGITDPKEDRFFIGEVLHKTHIEVDEKGTKAAAVTVVITKDCCASIEEVKYVDVVLDRPFVYCIIDCEQKLPVFIGTMEQP